MDVENFLGSIEEKTEFMYFRNYCIEEKKIENYTGQIERIMIKYN